MTPKEIDARYSSLHTLSWALMANILPTVRLISIEWNRNPPYIYFYVEDEVTEELQELIDEPFHHVDMDPIEGYELKIVQVNISEPIEYKGDCFFARKEPSPVNQPVFLKEHSQLLSLDIKELIKKPKESLKTFQNSELCGRGELVDFKEPIGYYLNPTTKVSTITSKAVIYYGKKETYVIPAVPDPLWFEKMEKGFACEQLLCSFYMHIFLESQRALLGRVVPALESLQIYWTFSFLSYLLSSTVYERLTEEDRENLELAYFEILAGIPPEMQVDFQCIIPESGYESPVAGTCVYLKKGTRAEEPHAHLTRLQKIKRRLQNLDAITSVLKGRIPFGVRLISLAWITKPVFVYFYFHASKEITMGEMKFFSKSIEELCMQADSNPPKPFCTLSWPEVSSVDYSGECIFVSDPRVKDRNSHSNPAYFSELSTCTHFDIPFLLQQKQPSQVVKSFRVSEFQGHGELIDFGMVIGTYLNPTTHESVGTTKAVVYYGVRKIETIPAIPDPRWFEELQQEFLQENETIDFKVHIQREAHRAMLGRVPPSLFAMTISYESKPYLVSFFIADMLSRADREMIELVWFEMMAGMPVELEFQAKYIKIAHASEVNKSDYCVYLCNEGS